MAKLLTKEEWTRVLPKLKYILSDCDGVLWNGDNAIPGARESCEKLRSEGKQICYVTNNSTKTRRESLQKCLDLKFQARLEEVFCTSYCTAAYLQSKNIKSVYLIGSPAVHAEIVDKGIKCNALGPDVMDGRWKNWLDVKLEPDIEAVVVAFDFDFTMAKVCRAASYLLNPRCHFIATNRDELLPSDRKDIVIPGTGCIVSCVETAAGRPPTVVGKPNKPLVDMVRLEYPDLTPENTLFIGDRLNTDIELGRRNGFMTLLVESGAHNRNDIKPEEAPTYYTPSLKDIYDFMS